MPTGAQYQLTSSGSLALMSKIYQGDVEVVVARVETIGMLKISQQYIDFPGNEKLPSSIIEFKET